MMFDVGKAKQGTVPSRTLKNINQDVPSLQAVLSLPMSEKARGKLARIKELLLGGQRATDPPILTMKTIKKDDDQ